jgi:DNA-binding MarR family transcriptional regulator
MIEDTKTQPNPDNCSLQSDARLEEIAQAAGMSADGAAAIAKIDQVMAMIRKSMSRRDFGRAIINQIDSGLDVAHMDVIGAIVAGAGEFTGAERAHEVTVGLVAERLAIDPSRASRLVAEVVEKGYARRVASQADARRICLELTEKGRELAQTVRETKWQIFSNALGSWDESELIEFARLLERFSTWTREGLKPPAKSE